MGDSTEQQPSLDHPIQHLLTPFGGTCAVGLGRSDAPERGHKKRRAGAGQISRQVSANASAAELPNHPSG